VRFTKIIFLLIAVLFISSVACSQHDEKQSSEAVSGPDYPVLGIVQDDRITEASGMIASRRNPGWLWLHNDSGDRARLFAVGTSGDSLGELRLQGVIARDWEDIAIGPGTTEGVPYLYIGDIGDNERAFAHAVVYRFPEPAAASFTEGQPLIIEDFEKLEFVYPDGPHDIEVLLVDPDNEDLYLVTKRIWPTKIFRAAGPQQSGSKRIVEVATTVNMGGFSAGDFSPDGEHILLKTAEYVFHWSHYPGQNLAQVFSEKPDTLPYVREPQGEAISFSSDGSGYYTVSEELNGSIAAIAYYTFNSDSLDTRLKP
jgi:hypothetical protein